MVTKEYSCPKCGNTITTSIEEKWMKAISSLPVACPECGAVSPMRDYKESIEKKYDGRYVLTPVNNSINMLTESIPLHIGSNIIGRLKKDMRADVNVGIEVSRFVPVVKLNDGRYKYHPDRTSGRHAKIIIEFDEREIPIFTITPLDKNIYINGLEYKKSESNSVPASSIKINIGSIIRLGDFELRLEDLNSGTLE